MDKLFTAPSDWRAQVSNGISIGFLVLAAILLTRCNDERAFDAERAEWERERIAEVTRSAAISSAADSMQENFRALSAADSTKTDSIKALQYRLRAKRNYVKSIVPLPDSGTVIPTLLADLDSLDSALTAQRELYERSEARAKLLSATVDTLQVQNAKLVRLLETVPQPKRDKFLGIPLPSRRTALVAGVAVGLAGGVYLAGAL